MTKRRRTLLDYLRTDNNIPKSRRPYEEFPVTYRDGFHIQAELDDKSLSLVKKVLNSIEVEKISGFNYCEYEKRANGVHHITLTRYDLVDFNTPREVTGLRSNNVENNVDKIDLERSLRRSHGISYQRSSLKVSGTCWGEKYILEFCLYIKP